MAYFQDRRPSILDHQCYTVGFLDYIEENYITGAYLLDPFHELHVNNAPRGVYRLSDIAPVSFQRSRYFKDFYRTTNMHDELVFVSYPAHGVSIHVCLGRNLTSNLKFTSMMLAKADRISPIVSALVEAHWKGLSSSGEYLVSETIADLIESVEKKLSIRLSPRQAEVAFYILKGHSSVSIGICLHISPLTVKVFRKQLYKKCNISSQAELFNLLLPLLGT